MRLFAFRGKLKLLSSHGLLEFLQVDEEKRMSESKVDVGSSFYRLLHPKLAVLLTCIDEDGKANIITLAWAMPASIHPPLVVVSIAPARYSHGLIEKTKEFVLNVPTMEKLKETFFCGRKSGRDVDKFKETGLTPLPARKVKAPIIKECVAHLECKLYKQVQAGDHTLFIGEVVAAYADENVFTKTYDLEKTELIYHMGGDKFTTLTSKATRPEL